MSKALKSRLAKLEQVKVRRFAPRLVYKIYGRDDRSLIGFETSEGIAVMRSALEPLEALKERAWELTSGVTLSALYAPVTAPETDNTEPLALPSLPEPSDPYALAGIGREATREELIRMGAIRIPQERPIEKDRKPANAPECL